MGQPLPQLPEGGSPAGGGLWHGVPWAVRGSSRIALSSGPCGSALCNTLIPCRPGRGGVPGGAGSLHQRSARARGGHCGAGVCCASAHQLAVQGAAVLKPVGAVAPCDGCWLRCCFLHAATTPLFVLHIYLSAHSWRRRRSWRRPLQRSGRRRRRCARSWGTWRARRQRRCGGCSNWTTRYRSQRGGCRCRSDATLKQ